MNNLLISGLLYMHSSHSTMDRGRGCTPVLEDHGSFIRKVLELVFRAAFSGTDRSNPVIRWRTSNHLKQILPFELSNDPKSDEELLSCLEKVIQYSTKTGHPHFANQLFSGLDPYGLAGQLVTDALNPSIYTYEVAPVFTLMEAQVLAQMTKLVGYEDGDGIFCPGGSFANGFAINLARFNLIPSIKKCGLEGGCRLVLFASEDAHYSVHKMSALLGLGEDGVISVATDSLGCMDPLALESAIELAISRHLTPFLIFATAGTTVLGAFDPLLELSTIAAKYKVWLHVDAAWGGGLLFSHKHRNLLKGIERADSVTWNPHKLLAVPQQCSTLLLRKKGMLLDCHSRKADYLFQKDKFYDTDLDVGDKYLQCGRRADVLKFWLMWKAKGSDGLAEHIDHLMAISQYTHSKVVSHPQMVLVSQPQFINVCFWFVPKQMNGLQSHPDYLQMLHQVAPKIKERMMRRGTMMINYQPLRKWPNFFRFVLQNSSVTSDDIDFFIGEIERYGNEDSDILTRV